MFAFILTPFTPVSWAVENGPIEWLQVVVLGGIWFLAVTFSFSATRNSRKLFLWSVPLWLLMIGRELSWGRVFLHNADGKMPKMSELWYGQYVEQAIFIVMIIILGELFKHGLFAEVRKRIREGRVPLVDIAIVVVGAVIASLIEHYGAGLLGDRESVFEEVAELATYSVLLVIVAYLGFDRSSHTAPLSTFIRSYHGVRSMPKR
jgi:hypothetical protein